MKKLKLSLFTVLFTSMLFAISPVKADSPGQPCNGIDPDAPCGGGGDTSMPIDSHIWYLFAAAGVVGARVIVNKTRKSKAVII